MHYESIRNAALVWIAAGSLLGSACGDDSTPPASDSTGGDSTSSTTMGMTSINMTTGTTVAADSTTGMADGSFLDPSTDTGDPPMPMPNGSPCSSADDCESGYCYDTVIQGMICSECLTDEDCDAGTCAIDFMVGYAVCTDGGVGSMCNTDEGCVETVCTELIDTMGIFPLNFCSECRPPDNPGGDGTEVPCPMGQICSPVYDLQNIAGYYGCVDPGTVANGGGCPVVSMGMGDGTPCESGICGVAAIDGLPIPIELGVCGDCANDMDCMPMEMCEPPTADLRTGITPSMCI